ncbi:hypothetical protein GPECTOR_33g647 [Gonium pectorale]|uniref:Uncharacterized protein n=1 Tax=Gonium pectorale TaxID=33097 RepID=A0A150GDU7_GONPE|nr:hypothetical protein GPECTOR_33g647 [Gonium pectorale]|eukprot:KXZ47765.1 hypothetical protein GPECTOR_33g647 [Gonium pectorale]
MFKLLAAHEEREPRAVLKCQSKRAQKKIQARERKAEEREESSRHNGSNGGFDNGDLNLGLLWDLLEGGLSLLPDALAEAAPNGDLERLAPDAQAAIRRLVAEQCAAGEGDKPARGLSQEDMITMMARAHNRQLRINGFTQRSGGSEGDDGDDSDDDDRHYYGREEGEVVTRTWRHTREWMERNDWVRVTDTDGKHFKYRRLLPNGQIQTQTVCCSSSDSLRGVRNLQSDLAKKVSDTEANAVIREWRRAQRQRKTGPAASGAQ